MFYHSTQKEPARKKNFVINLQKLRACIAVCVVAEASIRTLTSFPAQKAPEIALKNAILKTYLHRDPLSVSDWFLLSDGKSKPSSSQSRITAVLLVITTPIFLIQNGNYRKKRAGETNIFFRKNNSLFAYRKELALYH